VLAEGVLDDALAGAWLADDDAEPLQARWWVENRPDAPLLFEEELKEALEKIRKAPEAPKVYRVERGRATRRVLMETTGCHVYYRVENPNLVRTSAVRDTRRRRACRGRSRRD